MPQIERLEPGARMSEATCYDGRIYTAGVVADEAAGKCAYSQTLDILTQIDGILARLGSDKTHILKANIWLRDIADFSEMNRAWDSWVVAGKAPARATVEAKLAAPEYAVEIMIEAVKP